MLIKVYKDLKNGLITANLAHIFRNLNVVPCCCDGILWASKPVDLILRSLTHFRVFYILYNKSTHEPNGHNCFFWTTQPRKIKILDTNLDSVKSRFFNMEQEIEHFFSPSNTLMGAQDTRTLVCISFSLLKIGKFLKCQHFF